MQQEVSGSPPQLQSWGQFKALLETMRPKQWAKNVVIFVGLVFSDERGLLNPVMFGRTLAAFIIFCLLSSAIYLMNDLIDIEKDRAHPKKRFRPLAAGRLNVRLAQTAFVVLLVGMVLAAFALNLAFGIIALIYVLNNVAYNLRLKHMVLLDVFSLATGYILRAFAGALVLSVAISPWLYVVTILLSLLLGFGKRRHELILLQQSSGSYRRVLEEYSLPMLDQMLTIVTASTVSAYTLYTFTAPNLPENHAMMATIPFALYGIFRYLYLIHRPDGGAPPDELFFKDRPLLITVILWGLVVFGILYIF